MSHWLNTLIPKAMDKFEVQHGKDIGVLVRKNISLEHLHKELILPARFYFDDFLGARATSTARIFSALLSYRLNPSVLIQDVLDTIGVTGWNNSISREALDRKRAIIRDCGDSELLANMKAVGSELFGGGLADVEVDTLKLVLADSNQLDQYRPIQDNEIQIMTLHKAKGLEFDVVFHLDLYDWVFPRRERQGDDWNVFPSWDQELNLHYVGVTRARKACCLMTSNKRINVEGRTLNGNPSQFFGLPGFEGCFK